MTLSILLEFPLSSGWNSLLTIIYLAQQYQFLKEETYTTRIRTIAELNHVLVISGKRGRLFQPREVQRAPIRQNWISSYGWPTRCTQLPIDNDVGRSLTSFRCERKGTALSSSLHCLIAVVEDVTWSFTASNLCTTRAATWRTGCTEECYSGKTREDIVIIAESWNHKSIHK